MSVAADPVPSAASQSSATLANRVVGFLGWAGVFVASVLTYSHMTEHAAPCGGSRGCETVARDPSSVIFNVPVALIGLVGYLALVGLSVARPLMGKANWRLLTNLSLAGTMFGFFASVYFMYTSLAIIKATCLWCVGSAIIMTLSLILTGWLWSCEDPDVKPSKWDSLTHLTGLVLSLGLAGAVAVGMDQAPDIPPVVINDLTMADLLPDKAKVRGDDNAPVTVIEFADFNCPTCRSIAPTVEKTFRSANGKIKWAFRNVPLVNLKGHETSMHAATLAELAAKNGKFWTFFDTAMKPENTERVKSVDGLKAIALDTGLKIDDISSSLKKTSDEAKSVVADMDLALRIGATSTPTFVILASGVEPKAVSARRFVAVINGAPYRELIWGK